MERLTPIDRSAWSFVNGEWEDGPEGDLLPALPPRKDAGMDTSIQGYRFAFFKEHECCDLRARFRLCQTAHSDVGLIFRARSATSFYLLHFPCCGQACRAQNFWVVLSRMEPSGYLKLLKLERVRRVNSMAHVWHDAEVIVERDRLTAVVDGRGRFEASGLDLAPGCLGALLFNGARLRDLEIDAAPVGSASWTEGAVPPRNWFHPVPDTRFGPWQKPRDLLRAPGGDLLLAFQGVEGFGGTPRYYLTRSADNGRTWSEPEFWFTQADGWTGARRVLHTFPDGRLRCVTFGPGLKEIRVAETADGGRSWRGETEATIGPLPADVELHVGPQAFLNLRDGTTLLFLYGRHSSMAPEASVYSWSAYHCQAFVSRSTDGGSSWSAPVNIDGTRDPNTGSPVVGNLDLTEVCAVETTGGAVLALVRPIHAGWMWETWSRDGGATWEPCVPGAFPGYATPNMLRTTSGAILVAHRLPGLTLNVSRDEGQSWDEGTMIDSAIWAMGAMLEVEPDVALYVYFDSFEGLMRAQRIRVTATGIEPAG